MVPSAPAAEACLGVVLAGGRSRRMGRDKALLMWQGRTLIDHALDRFSEIGLVQSLVSGDRPAHAGIPDLQCGQGPLAGLLAVARAHPGRRLLLVPVDMPMLPAAWLARLATAAPAASPLHFEGSPLPLRIDARPGLIALLSRWLDDPDGPRAIRHLLSECDAHTLPAPDASPRALDNANTPEDWARMKP